MKDAGERATDAIIKSTEKRIGEIYSNALKKAIKDNSAFLQKIKDVDSGKIKPNSFYDTPEKIAKWREGFTREALRQDKVIAKIKERLANAGEEARAVVKKAGTDIYSENRTFTADKIEGKTGVSFAQYDRRQIETLLSDTQTPFSKIAYKNMGANPDIVRRLASEMAQATIGGESQTDVIKRIRAVTGQSQYQAQRVAQTERTRLQSQARNDVGTEAAKMGLKITKTWSARMVNTRDTHAALDGTTIGQDETFVLIDGDRLAYPGDPNGAAENTINCHCVLITDVGV